ncbi:MAG: hypothetical protein IT406_02605 [Candidatus Yanofskybacteria bacterium]|nr:hypothetical protein [Candidatus Yanofskybacteria bacterium]
MYYSRDRLLSLGSCVGIVLLVALLSVHTLTSIYQDIGRHIRIGSIIWATHHIPETNLFSYTAPDFPFVNHHWLGSLALYLGERLVGLQGLITLKAALIALAFGLAYAAAWRAKSAAPSLVVGVAALFALIERTDVRPEVLSFVFLAWFLFVLYREERFPKLIWTLPAAQLIWVNAHIYFFMGPFVWAAFLIGRGVSSHGFREWARGFFRSRYAVITGLLALATVMNPSGIHGALYPITLWGNYGYSIVENQTPFFLLRLGYPAMTSWGLGVLAMLVALSFALNARRLRANIMGLLLVLGAGGLALEMIRNYPLFALCALPATLKNISELEWRWGGRGLMVGCLMVLGLLGASVVLDQIYPPAGLTGQHFGFIVPQGHQESVDFFGRAGIHGPIFNNFDIGSFLIWKLPEERVFIDGRPEAYPADFIQKTYIPMQEDPRVWRANVARYRINAIIWNTSDMTPWSDAFLRWITKDPEWVAVYREGGIMIMVHDVPQNADIIRRYRL